jgi:hypothetical protein
MRLCPCGGCHRMLSNVSFRVDAASARQSRLSESQLGYLLIAGFAAASYALVVGPYLRWTHDVLPGGDPFSYTITWFRTLDHARADYVGALLTFLNGTDRTWYRLMNVLIGVFSPLLDKEPASICAVNYLMWGLGAAAFYHLGRRLGLNLTGSFLVALIPWLWPISYGYSDYTSTPVLGLDAAFTGALHIALAMSFVFAIDPRRTYAAVLAGLAIGVAIWGRGNSLPVVGLVVCWPCVVAFITAIRTRDRRAGINILIVALIAGGMAVEFYWTYWEPLRGYYGAHANFIEQNTWSLDRALPYLRNVPGQMLWHELNSRANLVLSLVSHAVSVGVLVALWRSRFRYIAAAGTFIYFATFVANLILWNGPVITVENALYLFRPMLMGLSLSLIALLLHFRPELPAAFATPVFVVALVWGMLWTSALTPRSVGRPSPAAVERFASNMDSFVPTGTQMAFLWYDNYNGPLLIYYRLMRNMSEPPLFYRRRTADLWSMTSVPEDRATRVADIVAGIKEAFTQAGAVVIPEFVDDYGTTDPYALYRFRDDWAPWLNSEAAPKMRVVAILQESPIKRLLVLQREDVANGRGDPLRLPWGNRPAQAPPDYSANVVRF